MYFLSLLILSFVAGEISSPLLCWQETLDFLHPRRLYAHKITPALAFFPPQNKVCYSVVIIIKVYKRSTDYLMIIIFYVSLFPPYCTWTCTLEKQ